MIRKSILIGHPYFHCFGGSNALAAYAVQALSRDFAVTVATLGPVDVAAVNRSFGTALRREDFEVCIAPEKYRRPVAWLPTAGALLEQSLTIAWTRQLAGTRPFDLLLSTQNEADFGRPGMQYIHYPAWYLPRPAEELRWFHHIPGLLPLYRRFCFRIGGASRAGVAKNVTLVNSSFIAGRTVQTHACKPRVLYPPVPGEFAAVPWEERRAAIVGLGRLHPIKRWGMAVEIVDAVRQRGHDLGLTLIGHTDSPEETQRLRAMAATRPWLRILTGLSRARLEQEVVQHRYGIHTMAEEHFGIAPAELQRAGCVTFVHNSGGPPEIVGNDPRLLFDRVNDAVEKISRAIEDPATERDLRALVASRRDCFSVEQFCDGLRQHAHEFFSDRAVAAAVQYA